MLQKLDLNRKNTLKNSIVIEKERQGVIEVIERKKKKNIPVNSAVAERTKKNTKKIIKVKNQSIRNNNKRENSSSYCRIFDEVNKNLDFIHKVQVEIND